ncbi:DNA topoisomerase IB [Sphingomonas bacterium]|uniref:DNA topoisomerase IB n=1 Tax=Sphingomonas bacterium TaxID=1895847 RepID=UPI00262527B7|nr:DNA topoisomerase IB [Sphingomonas bacterium]MDB5677231.1 topoisomerase [Sphingomonas bacterium]
MTRLVYSDDSQPGIARKKVRHGWGYWDAEGKRITDRDEIERLNAIGLPPAYENAWFSPKPHGHIQAVGWDAKGRKQYRYHVDFRSRKEGEKYDRCAAFGRALAKLRAQVDLDLKTRSHSKERTVAAIVKLLDIGYLRIGNEVYAQTNKSFGATTLRNRHAKVSGSTLKLQYRAKSGKMKLLAISDGSLARFVKKCQDLPGQQLFQYVGDDGEPHPVTSSDVNDYIREATGADFTAKHFRTWGASVLAFEALASAEGDIGLKTMLEPVTEALGNTPAIARKSYVHPALIELAKNGQAKFREKLALPRETRYLDRYERGLIAFLEAGAKPRRKAA